jgi:hypothetical protein
VVLTTVVQWKDGSVSWEKLSDLKASAAASNPMEVAEYAVANHLVAEPAFKWWVPHVIKRRNQIVSKVKSRYWKTTHKFGIRLPRTMEETLEIDRTTNTDLWHKAINKEMTKVKVAWKTHEAYIPKEVQDALVKY